MPSYYRLSLYVERGEVVCGSSGAFALGHDWLSVIVVRRNMQQNTTAKEMLERGDV